MNPPSRNRTQEIQAGATTTVDGGLVQRVIDPVRDYVAAGGLMSYASDRIDVSRCAATYVDRLLRGAKVSELPVQFPTKYQLVVNIKAAQAIGLTIPAAFLLHADELIE